MAKLIFFFLTCQLTMKKDNTRTFIPLPSYVLLKTACPTVALSMNNFIYWTNDKACDTLWSKDKKVSAHDKGNVHTHMPTSSAFRKAHTFRRTKIPAVASHSIDSDFLTSDKTCVTWSVITMALEQKRQVMDQRIGFFSLCIRMHVFTDFVKCACFNEWSTRVCSTELLHFFVDSFDQLVTNQTRGFAG